MKKSLLTEQVSETCNRKVPVITIDGLSGSGKGTIGLLLASKLQWHFLDSGAIYRILAFAATQSRIAFEDEKSLAHLAEHLPIVFQISANKVITLLDHQDISQRIRTEEISQGSSKVAALPLVRQALLDCQRRFQQPPGLVADGRDMGTTVFPEASLKFYFEASLEERARRRQKQLMENGFDVKLPKLIDELSKRDARDSQRQASPLLPAKDAIKVDTTNLSIDEVSNFVWQRVCQKRNLL